MHGKISTRRMAQRRAARCSYSQRVCSLALMLVAAASLLSQRSSATTYQPVHVVFLTDCSKYSNWQSLAMIFSFKMSGQPGTLTRVMCCSEQDRKTYPPALLNEVETHIAPSYSVHPRTGDAYAAYNKPEAVIDWLEHVTPAEEYVLVLDSDMILRRPFLVEEMQPKPGLAIGNRYSYMIGVANDLAMRHVPEVKPRNDTLAGPFGRRGDQVGGFFFIHRADLKRMSHGWLKYTEDVRADPLAYKDSGDMYAIHPGDKPWISEMYGYSFGASTADVWHKFDTTSMIYPYGAYDHGSRGPTTMPKLMHYGLLFEVNNYKFDKHWFYELDVMTCPPWETKAATKQNKRAGLFEHPPRIAELKEKDYLPTYYRDLLVIETAATMNAGFCDFHLRHCPPSQQLLDECQKAFDIYTEVANECRAVEDKLSCSDNHAKCETWAKDGECEKNPEYMEDTCRKACNKCFGGKARDPGLKSLGADLGKNLQALAEKLKGGGGQATSVVSSPALSPVPAPSPSTSPAAVVQQAVQQTVQQAQQAVQNTVQQAQVAVQRATEASSPATDAAPKPSPEVVATPSPRDARDEVVQLPAASRRTRSTKPRKDLIVRCYRLELNLEEIKQCVQDAKDGFEFARSQASERALSERRNSDDELVLQDEDDLTLRAKSPASHPLSTKTDLLPASAARMGAWQLTGLGVLVVAVLVAVVPKVFRRRAKSGMRLD